MVDGQLRRVDGRGLGGSRFSGWGGRGGMVDVNFGEEGLEGMGEVISEQ